MTKERRTNRFLADSDDQKTRTYGFMSEKRVLSSRFGTNSLHLGWVFCSFMVLLGCFQISEAVTCGNVNPCHHGGKCITKFGTGSCECPPDYIGEYCQYQNPCYPTSQCQNGGTCSYFISHNGAGFSCTCPLGYSASLCEIAQPNVCDSDPCYNHGTCRLDTLNTFKCICPAGFEGPTCEQVDHCASKPCQNGATCASTESGFQCRCTPGFIGRTCTEDVDECQLHKPCVRGTCRNLHGTYRCDCPVQYTGKNCESVYKPCEPSPCENNGKCVAYGPYQYTCECPAGFTGRHCEVNIDDCVNHMCQNGATCVDGIQGYTCKCTHKYKGEFCTTDVDECKQQPGICENGATCVNTVATPEKPDGYHCICVNGWEGKHCEINKDDCVGQQCYNGGTCHDLPGSFRCECPVGFTGLLCHLEDACMSNPCQNAAQKCSTNPTDGGYQCTCAKGFQGKDCSIDIDECSNGNPCEHGGTCVNTPGWYKCECTPGYAGEWCETNINECLPNPCMNEATCLDDIGKFICVCMPGYTGKYCEEYTMNECVSNPCQHSGRCMDLKNGYRCVCAAGYAGINCEENINDCTSSPCQNGGTCIDEVNGYKCHCSFPFSGEKCELLNDPCRNNKCINGGTCRTTSSGQSICQCPQGFKGTYCHEDVNECSLSPCQNGATCANLHGSFRCLCERGFTGKYCETNINDCASSKTKPNTKEPCRNGGTCVDMVDGYRCDCKTGFGDPDCGTDLDECASNPCLNGATCFDYTGYYICACPAGFSGRLCQKNDQDCHPGLCLNGGTCHDGVNRYRCHCLKGFGGKNCQTTVNETNYVAIEDLEKAECKKHNCERKANNGRCDTECNFVGCDYDGKDCSGGLNPFENCTNPKLCARVFKDGKCDEACNTEDCLFDGYDCIRQETQCNPLYMAYCQTHYGNGKCDSGCNNAGCGFDGGDCDNQAETKHEILAGDVVMVLLVEPEVLLNQSKKFLMIVSKMVHANVKIKRDKDGDLMIYRWNSDSGITGQVEVPENSALMDLGTTSSSFMSRRKKRSSILDDTLTGTLIMLTVDITKCVEDGREDCFTDVLNVAAYLGAASARDKLRQELGFGVYSAYGQRDIPVDPTGSDGNNNVMIGVLSVLACVALLFLVVLVLVRKRKIQAPIWVPSIPGKAPSTCSLDRPPSTKGSTCGSFSHHGSMAQPNTYEADCNFRRTPSFTRKDQYQINGQLAQYLNSVTPGQCESEWSDSEYAAYASGIPPPQKKQRSVMNQDYGRMPFYGEKKDKRNWTQQHVSVAQGAIDGAMNKPAVNSVGPDGQTPILVAASHGRYSEDEQALVVQNLINQGADLAAKTEQNQDCALILATKYGRVKPVQVMLEAGADPNETDSKGMSALHHAVLTNVIDNVKLLVMNQRTKIDLADLEETTPLILAAKMSHADRTSLELLVNHGASTAAADKDGKTALHWAAVHNNVAAIELLISKGANKDAQDSRDQTPLFLAAREGNLKAIEYLLHQGASKDITDQMDRQPRDIAEENYHKLVVDLLDKARNPNQTGNMFNPGNTATLPHSRAGTGKPKPPRRTKSMREGRCPDGVQGRKKAGGSKSQERATGISMVNAGAGIMIDGAQIPRSTSGQQMVYSPHSDNSPPSIVNFESPPSAGSSNFGTTPSPGSTLRSNSQNFNVPSNGQASSCALMSPYSNGSSSVSGLSPQQAYRSPPPYSGNPCGTPTGGTAAFYQRSPPNYGQSPPQCMNNPDMCAGSMTADYGYEGLDPVSYSSYVPTDQQDFYLQAQTQMHMNFSQQGWMQDDSGAYHVFNNNGGIAC